MGVCICKCIHDVCTWMECVDGYVYMAVCMYAWVYPYGSRYMSMRHTLPELTHREKECTKLT